MNFSKNFSDLGAKMKTGADSLKQKTEAIKAKAIESALANAKGERDHDPNNFEESAMSPPKDAAAATTVSTAPASETQGEHVDSSAKASIRESLTGFASKFKHAETEEEVSDLVTVLSQLFDFDPKAKKQNEMVEALELQGITTWRGFLLMAEEDIPTLTKKGDAPVSKNSVRMLTYLKQFTLHNINSGVEGAKNPELYTSEAFDAFVDDLQLGRKSAISNKEEEDAGKQPMRKIRESMTGFASKLKPGIAKVQEGSISDILSKAKAKVSRGKGGNNNSGPPSDEVSVGATSAVSELGSEAYPGDVVIEDMKKNVEDLASKIETTAKDVENKEEAQKLMVPLLAKLKTSQDKFANMIEARKKKKAEKQEEEAAASGEVDEEKMKQLNDKFKHLFDGDDDKKQKLTNFLIKSDQAILNAFHNAEKVARQAAQKAGILDDGSSKEMATAEEELKDAFQAEEEIEAPTEGLQTEGETEAPAEGLQTEGETGVPTEGLETEGETEAPTEGGVTV